MKAHFHLVPRKPEQNFLARQHTLPNFGTVWHYHPEIELHYVIRGEGVRFVGDNISNFYAGELLLLGENLPHMWRCSEKYFQGDHMITAEAIVVHFLPSFMGKDFFELPESTKITTLYDKAKAGLEIRGNTKQRILSLMQKSVREDGLSRLVLILKMLEILSFSEEMEPISSGKLQLQSNKEENERLNRVYQHSLQNYCSEVSLKEIAAVANLSVTSFCRYFKMMTKKTFHEFLIELRISHARKLLMDDGLVTVETVCFDCGFNNRSNFFRHFKRITGFTPYEFRKKCVENKTVA
jgi:AraC-like DNA-binding protein